MPLTILLCSPSRETWAHLLYFGKAVRTDTVSEDEDSEGSERLNGTQQVHLPCVRIFGGRDLVSPINNHGTVAFSYGPVNDVAVRQRNFVTTCTPDCRRWIRRVIRSRLYKGEAGRPACSYTPIERKYADPFKVCFVVRIVGCIGRPQRPELADGSSFGITRGRTAECAHR